MTKEAEEQRTAKEGDDKETMAEDKKMSLLELAENSMAQSLMIFLFANLRLLSATGRIGTKYEYLSIDTDKVQRDRATDFAGYSHFDFESHGITGGYMMAVFLLEITQEAEDLRHREAGTGTKDVDIASSLSDQGPEPPGQFFGVKNDLEAVNGGMHALLKVFRNMIASDISDDIHKVSKEEYPIDRDPVTPKKADSAMRRSTFLTPVTVTDDDETEALFTGRFSMRPRELVGRPAVRREAYRQSIALQNIAEIQDNMFADALESNNTGIYNREELAELLKQAIKRRDFSRLGFVKNFFKEGSLSRLLVESKAEMVWLNDWHNTHECTYAISVDKGKKQVLLSFRGAYTKTDWKHIWDMKFASTGNPIEESYPGRPKNISLHSGFHKYLFRSRKDTGTTKYDEITSKLAFYCDQVGEGAKVIVTGHSLGAALTTVVALYASTDERFTRYGALEAVPFGGPYVGGYKFSDVVRYQESKGKLRIARFHNSRDGVAHLPPALMSMSKRGALYFSNGIDVKLPLIRKGIFSCLPQPQPIMTFKCKQSFLKSYCRQAREWYFFNLPVRVWLSGRMHSLNETKKRLELIKLLDDHESSPLVKYSLEELYDMRDELKTSA